MITTQKTAESEDLPGGLVEALADALAAMGHRDPTPNAALWSHDPDVTLVGAWGPIRLGVPDLVCIMIAVGVAISLRALV